MLANISTQFQLYFNCLKMYEKSLFTFGLLASSLVMLSVMPLLNNNNMFNAMAQGYDIYRDNVIIANIQPTTRNMSVEQVHLKDFL